MALQPYLDQSVQDVFDDMFEGIQIIDFERRYLYLNRAAAAHGRRSAAELIGRSMSDAYPGIEGTEMFALLERCLSERVPQRMINLFSYADGGLAWFDLRMNPVPMGVLVLSVDISDQKKAEAALRHSREDLAITLESMADGVITTDLAQRVTHINPAAEALTGWSEQEARGRHLDEMIGFLNQRTGERVDHAVQRVLHGGVKTGLANDTFLIARDGARIPVASSGAPLRDANGAIRGVVLVLKNMKQEYELAALLQQSQKLEAIGRVAASVAHDFNNLLTVILGYCHSALEEAPAAGALREDLVEIDSAALRARELTQQLLAFSRKGVLKPEALDVNELITGMLGMLRRLVSVRITVTAQLQPGLPDVLFDRGQLGQVIMNLVLNARDAMPNGGTLTIETAGALAWVAVVVRDTGVGMDATTRARIFEPFFTTKPEGKGTGLGLATTYGIVEQSGGHIRVESEPNRGTTFTVLLPIVTGAGPARG